MDAKDTSGALNVAITAARDAGKIIAQNISLLDRIKVTKKSNSNNRVELVSEIDLQAERVIIEQLKHAYADFNVIGEESGDAGLKSDYTWMIDPLDGTHNFLHGHPHCCVSIALLYKNQAVAAVVYDPFRNELFTARKGAGAQLDGRRIRVSESTRLSDSLVCTGFPYQAGTEVKQWLKSFAAMMPRTQSIHRTGSSVLDLAYVACGRYDGFWEFGLKDWDIAAGSLLIKEAGGLITNMNGKLDLFGNGHILAGTANIHEKMLQLIRSL